MHQGCDKSLATVTAWAAHSLLHRSGSAFGCALQLATRKLRRVRVQSFRRVNTGFSCSISKNTVLRGGQRSPAPHSQLCSGTLR